MPLLRDDKIQCLLNEFDDEDYNIPLDSDDDGDNNILSFTWQRSLINNGRFIIVTYADKYIKIFYYSNTEFC